MNEVLRDAYIEDCQEVVDSWSRILTKKGVMNAYHCRIVDSTAAKDSMQG